MNKKTIDMVTIETKKANSQSLTCFITFITAATLCVALILVACVLPAVVNEVTETICWISMALEATSVGFGFIAYWIKRNTL